MSNLKLPPPRLIEQSVPANRRCGLTEDEWQEAVEPPAGISTEPATQCATPDPSSVSTQTAQSLVNQAKASITEIDVERAKRLIADTNTTVVDVREPSEYEAGALPGAILLPRGVLEFKIGGIPELSDPTKPVLVYCRTGGRASLAAQTMQLLGYTNVVSLAGGYQAWNSA